MIRALTHLTIGATVVVIVVCGFEILNPFPKVLGAVGFVLGALWSRT